MAIPMSPSSPMRLMVSWGKRASRSISAAIGRMSDCANSRAIACTICCSSVRSRSRLLLQELLKFRRERGHHLEEIAHDAVVGDLENGRLRVLVDRHDDLRRAHAREVLDGARHAEAEVELRR